MLNLAESGVIIGLNVVEGAESNRWPSDCEPDALPTELHPHGNRMLNRNLWFGKR